LGHAVPVEFGLMSQNAVTHRINLYLPSSGMAWRRSLLTDRRQDG